MTVGIMALAVPLSSNFAGEFLILAGVFQQGWAWAAIGAGAIVLAAMYMLRVISAVLHREVGPAVSESALDLRSGELAVVVPLVAVLLALSAWPAAITDRAFAASGASAQLAPKAASHRVAISGVPETCRGRTITFMVTRGTSLQAYASRMRLYVANHPGGGGNVAFKASKGTVDCLDGGRLEVSLPAISVPVPDRKHNPTFRPTDFIESQLLLSHPSFLYTPPVPGS
jgi:hypothetical protein